MTVPDVRSMRVLLLEDNPGDARLVREYLRDAQGRAVELQHAESLAEATALLNTSEFDAALIDLSLQDSDGVETYRSIRSLRPDLAIVVLSGYSDEGIALQAVHEGAQDYLMKGRADGEILVRALRYAHERQQLEQQRRDFIAMVSHELRNPLAAILGWAELLRKSQTFNERAVNVVIDQAGHLDRLIEDLIDVARLDARQLELRSQEVDIVQIAREAAESAQKTTEQHELCLETSTPRLIGVWDKDRVQQIFQNVLSNAIKYSPEGGRITVQIYAEVDSVCLSISDEGMGLTPEVQARLFSRFYRSETAKESRRPGLGLGLHITRSLVEAHGGTIHAKSDGPGLGSTFTITLPISGVPATTAD